MKRTVILMMLGLLIALAPAFAGGGREAADPEQITLTVWDFKYGEVDNAQPVFKAIDELYMSANPNVTVQHVGQPNAQYDDIIRAAVAAQAGPDVMILRAVSTLVEFTDYLIELDEYIVDWRDQINPASLAYTSVGRDLANGVRGIPLTTQLFGIYYNKTLFEQAGLDPESPPKDWEDFVAASEALVAAGITPMIWGGTPGQSMELLIRSLVLNYADAETQQRIASGELRLAELGWFEDVLVYMKEIVDRWVNEEGVSDNLFNQASLKFQAGQGAMIVGLGSDILHWKNFEDALGRGTIGFFPNINLPSGVYRDQLQQMPAGLAWSVPVWTEHVEEAVEFIKAYVTGEGAGLLMNDLGALVPNVAFDYNELGYSSLSDIVTYFPNNGLDYMSFISRGALTESRNMMDLYFNFNEITVEELVEEMQKAIDEDNR